MGPIEHMIACREAARTPEQLMAEGLRSSRSVNQPRPARSLPATDPRLDGERSPPPVGGQRFKVETPNVRFGGPRAGAMFAGGVGFTDDPAAAVQCRQLGYRVTERTATPGPAAGEAGAGPAAVAPPAAAAPAAPRPQAAPTRGVVWPGDDPAAARRRWQRRR